MRHVTVVKRVQSGFYDCCVVQAKKGDPAQVREAHSRKPAFVDYIRKAEL